MKTSGKAQKVFIDRYQRPGEAAQRWGIERAGDAWRLIDPDGQSSGAHPTIADALRGSNAVRFEHGAALVIRTTEGISPFDLFPALQAWANAPGAIHDGAATWSEDPDVEWINMALEDHARGLSLDYGRLIRIDDRVCGVFVEQNPSGKFIRRHLALFELSDPMWPVFYDEWASTSTDNGWGMGTYEIGEITPGFEGEVRYVDGIGPDLSIRPLAADHPAGLYDAMVAWVDDLVSVTSGFEEYRLEEDGDEVTVDLPEGTTGEAGAGFGPTVLASRSEFGA